MDQYKPKVLVIAEAANPEWVSVPLIGWSLFKSIAKISDAHMVTHARNERALKRTELSRNEYSLVDTGRIGRSIWQLSERLRGGSGRGWTTVMAFQTLEYYYFEYLVWKTFGDAIRNGQYDIVHRVTPMSPTTPGILAHKCKKAGVPFVWGPINGGVPWPKGFNSARNREREWLSYVASFTTLAA